MATYRKINEWKNHSRDVVESFKRYYHNSFLDSQRQEAFNLFLGNYIYVQGQPMLWDLTSDYYLHHSDPRLFKSYKPRHYINWYTPAYLEKRVLPDTTEEEKRGTSGTTAADEYWLEYYRPLAITSFSKTFSFKIGSRPRYLPDLTTQEIETTPSPFLPRNVNSTELLDQSAEKKQSKVHVTIVDPKIASREFPNGGAHVNGKPKLEESFTNGISDLKISDWPTASSTTQLLPSDRSQWTVKQWYENLLDPTVAEEDEYVKYVNYPLNQQLVTGTEVLDISGNRDFISYLARGEGEGPAASHVPTLDDLARYHEDVEDIDDALFGDMDPESLADYAEFLAIINNPEPLTVTEGDEQRKRYKAYRQWLKGRSFFKLSKLDPEWRSQN
jgi:phosphatidylinositol 3,5-bisphosphate 5-phosphatase